jgi:hypothetical protein
LDWRIWKSELPDNSSEVVCYVSTTHCSL